MHGAHGGRQLRGCSRAERREHAPCPASVRHRRRPPRRRSAGADGPQEHRHTDQHLAGAAARRRGRDPRRDRVADRRRADRGGAARPRADADPDRHPARPADPGSAARDSRRLLPRRHPTGEERPDDSRRHGVRWPPCDDHPDPGHQRSVRHQRHVAAAVARRNPRPRHRHRREQLPRGQLPGRVQHRRRRRSPSTSRR